MSLVEKNKFLCVHGHFYQPPRENPWTQDVDPQDSARPYHDWNRRIAQECYGPNAAGPVIDERGLIVAMADNYEKISFNFGPTLLIWLERHEPALYAKIIGAGARGNALAQPYIHAILPLLSLADKRTLVRWGLEDYRRRYGREAEGMWLPETAVDEETLDVLADAGLKFTILAPWQAARVRPVGGGDSDWKDVDEKTLLPSRPYRWKSKTRQDRSLALFFFHPGLHRAVIGGEAFVAPDALFKKIFGRTRPDDSVELLMVATDGEFFGHHHRRGASALATTMMMSQENSYSVVTPADFLRKVPPPQDVEILENTAWSCAHGLGRWTKNCGCRLNKDWKQDWRGPMLEAIRWLSEKLERLYENKAGDYFKDYKRAKELYAEQTESFLEQEGFRLGDGDRKTMALKLLEMQRHRLSAFTSCGWFFDDISGVEAVQCLAHAARAIELAAAFGEDFSEGFQEQLALCPSNVKAFHDGRGVYQKLVLPQRVDHRRLAAHYAILEHLRRGLGSVPAGWAITAAPPARSAKEDPEGRLRSLTALRLELTELATLETFTVTAVVHQRDRLDFACRLGPGGFSAAGLFSAFSSLDDAGFEREVNEALGPAFVGLDALLPEDRGEVLRWLTPDPAGGPRRREFMDRWTAAVAELKTGGAGDKILPLLEAAREDYKLPVDRLPWIDAARGRLRRELEGLVSGADEISLERAGRWLEGFERSGVHVDVWELQHVFWRWKEGLASRQAGPSERRLLAAFGEKLGFADSALPLETQA